MRESTLAFLNVCHFPRLPLSKAAPHPPAWASRQEGGGAGRVPWRCNSRPGGSGPLVFKSAGLRATDGTALLRTSPPRSGRGGLALRPPLLQPLEQPRRPPGPLLSAASPGEPRAPASASVQTPCLPPPSLLRCIFF